MSSSTVGTAVTTFTRALFYTATSATDITVGSAGVSGLINEHADTVLYAGVALLAIGFLYRLLVRRVTGRKV